ncbi:MAG: WcaF family extracellular polysaccharide biosynthesis acetyltransferase [Henriciella sp.]|nr:WcaF family extracellular polysaccharide biosynthesis acetyltransferase [Henriciella sp.]
MKLETFDNSDFKRGRSLVVELVWIVVSVLLFRSPLPGSGWRRSLLRLFGAKISDGVVIKPNVRIKFPWRLSVGAHSWIGEDVWIDNLAMVTIGESACLSQAAYLCTGSHDWAIESFDLITEPITLEDKSWVAAKAVVAPGVTIKEGAVLALGSVAHKDLEPWTVYVGNPAEPVRPRAVRP